ncbi:MAG: hypothetical protein R2939_19115 [Kofleriaceae bacterium]
MVVIRLLLARGRGGKAPPRLCGGCQRAMPAAAWTRCLFCGWRPGARLEFIHGPMAGTSSCSRT